MAASAHTLHFYGNELGKEVDLMLLFEPPANAGTLYQQEFPVCWETIKFAKEGMVFADVEYTGTTVCFAYKETSDKPKLTGAKLPRKISGNSQVCPVGDKCEVKAEGSALYFTDPVEGRVGYLTCSNQVREVLNIGIGFVDEGAGGSFSPSVVWTKGYKDVVVAQLSPLLHIYVTSSYKKSQVITGPIGFDPQKTLNLTTLPTHANLEITVDPNTLIVSITLVK